MKLRGKTAVVIGGASGICLATARNCLKEGLAVSRNRQRLGENHPNISLNLS